MNKERMESFIDAVRQMRKTQKEYFKTRDKAIMRHSMVLEGVVDRMLKEIEEDSKLPKFVKDLFDNNREQ